MHRPSCIPARPARTGGGFVVGGLASLALAASLGACTTETTNQPNLVGQDVRLTIIHTADIHSRLFPYRFVPGKIDQDYGLNLGEGPYGGIARIGSIVKGIRATSARSLWLDSGDCFEGAPVFNLFRGEAEFRALTELGVNAAVLGNHEFDLGSNNLYEQAVNWAGFPLLAANYYFDDPTEPNKPKLGQIIKPYQFFDVDGLHVAVIGMANQSSMTGIFEGGNSLGIRPLDSGETVTEYVKLVRPAADVVVLLSHMGLDEDEGLSANQVTDENLSLPLDGVDLVLGGHLHIVLNPPKIASTDKYGHQTVLVHSGAFAKYVGRLDLVVHVGTNNADPANRSYITAFTYDNLPVSCGPRASPTDDCPNPSDPDTIALLQPYDFMMNQVLDLHGVFAYVDAPSKVVRNDPSGGDSQLGNLVARAMQQRPGVDADFALTNSLGIRADFEQGPLTLEDMYNVFPFENTITVMFLSGSEVQETLDFVARKSSERGCRTQAQVAGIYFTMVCGADPHAEDVYIGDGCRLPDGSIDDKKCLKVIPEGLYRVAVNDYIAAGGSGFTVLKRNTSKLNTGISLRTALVDYIRESVPRCPMTLVDSSDPSTPQKTVFDNYGLIGCIDQNVEPHDDRILAVFK